MMQIILVGAWASFLCGVKATASQAWLPEEEGGIEGLKMLQVKHVKMDNAGKRLEAASDTTGADVREVVLLQGVFEGIGGGCCSGPRDVENGHMWSGHAPDLSTCQVRCRGFVNCGAVEYGWSGDADKDWCVIWNDMQTCSKLETGPEKCGNNSASVRAYKFKKSGMTHRAASQQSHQQNVTSQVETPKTIRAASEEANLAQQDEVLSPVATGMPGQTDRAPASIAQEATYQQAASWECHLYNQSAGQDDDWCMRTKQHKEYAYLYTGGKAKVCGGCWCCKSRLFQVAPEPPVRSMVGMDSNASLKELGANEGLPEQVVAGSRHHLATLKMVMELIQAAPFIAFIAALLFGIIGAASSSLWQRKAGSSTADKTAVGAVPPPQPHPSSAQRCNCLKRKGLRGGFGVSCAWHRAKPMEGVPASEPISKYTDEGLAKEKNLKEGKSGDDSANKGQAVGAKAAEEVEQEPKKGEVVDETAAAEELASEKGTAEKAAAEKAVAEKAAAARVVAEQAAAAKVALEKAVAELAAAEKAAAAEQIPAEGAVLVEAAAKDAASEETAADQEISEQSAFEESGAAIEAAERTVFGKHLAEPAEIEESFGSQLPVAQAAPEEVVADEEVVEKTAVKQAAAEDTAVEKETAEKTVIEEAEAQEAAIVSEEAIADKAKATHAETTSVLTSSLPASESAAYNHMPSDPMSEWWGNDLDTNISQQSAAGSIANIDISGDDKATTDQVLDDKAELGKEEEPDKDALEDAVVGMAPGENSVNTANSDKTPIAEDAAKEEDEDLFLDAEGEISTIEEDKTSA